MITPPTIGDVVHVLLPPRQRLTGIPHGQGDALIP